MTDNVKTHFPNNAHSDPGKDPKGWAPSSAGAADPAAEEWDSAFNDVADTAGDSIEDMDGQGHDMDVSAPSSAAIAGRERDVAATASQEAADMSGDPSKGMDISGPGDSEMDVDRSVPSSAGTGGRKTKYPRVDPPEVEDAPGQAIREDEPGYIAKAFPKLFPHGCGNFHDSRGGLQRLFKFEEWGCYIMAWHDGRFMRHTVFRYWLLDTALRLMTPGMQRTFFRTRGGSDGLRARRFERCSYSEVAVAANVQCNWSAAGQRW